MLRRKTSWASWRSFYYVLKTSILAEYKNRKAGTGKSTKPLKMYFLKEFQLVGPESVNRTNTFALYHSQRRDPFYFEAADQASLHSWVSCLSAVCSSASLSPRDSSSNLSRSAPTSFSFSSATKPLKAVPLIEGLAEEHQSQFKRASTDVEELLLQTISGSLRARWTELVSENERLRQENKQLRSLPSTPSTPSTPAGNRHDEHQSSPSTSTSTSSLVRRSNSHPPALVHPSEHSRGGETRLSFDLDTNAIEIGSKIHDGGSGASIHLATVSGWQCLVKELQRTSLSPEVASRFEFELAMLESLPTHDNLVRYLFHHTTSTHFQIFISRYDGSLAQLMAERIRYSMPFSAREITSCLSDIAAGLECLHRNDILHRDLKPDNIFITHDRNNCVSRYVVGDFDSAKNVRDRGEARTFVGTLSHMAPEIFSQQPYGKPCDIWSISVILYELITFERRLPQTLPFSAIFASQPSALAVDPSLYPPSFQGLIDIFRRCHVLDPLSRPSVTELRAMLFECTTQGGVWIDSPRSPLSGSADLQLIARGTSGSASGFPGSSTLTHITPRISSLTIQLGTDASRLRKSGGSPRQSPLLTSPKSVSPSANWRVEKYLGAGTGGCVFQVRHVHTGVGAAMKVVRMVEQENGDRIDHIDDGSDDVRNDAMDDEVKRRQRNEQLKREGEILKRLDHPNIVRLQECFEEDGKWHLVMELVSGGELLDRLLSYPDCRVPEPQARLWFRQLVSAVDYCHANGVAHRDLKLENLLVDSSGRLRVTDFGLAACFVGSDAFLKTLCGSARYAPPELMAGGMYRGPPLDVWALGIILFVILAGEFPWKAQTEGFSLMSEILMGRYQLPPHVSRPAADLIASILLLNPDDRPTTAHILSHPWLHPE